MLYADSHLHTNPLRGIGAKAVAERFMRVGGWFIAIVSLPPTSLGLDPNLEGFTKSLELAISECRAAREKGLRVSCLGGYHPAMVDKMIDKLGMKPEEAYGVSIRAIDLALKYIREGLLDGVAEIGRPHYQVKPHYVVLAEMILDYALEGIRDLDGIAHLHLEEGGWATAKDIDNRVKRLRVKRERIAMHHAKPGLAEYALSMGIPATIPALYPVIQAISGKLGEGLYMFESDYIDDPSRPGKVIYPWEIAENTEKAVREGLLEEEKAYKIHIDNIVKFYRVAPP
ncbi:MAG: TatD family hydrolase [Sulfolobales archaeon]